MNSMLYSFSFEHGVFKNSVIIRLYQSRTPLRSPITREMTSFTKMIFRRRPRIMQRAAGRPMKKETNWYKIVKVMVDFTQIG